MERRNVIHCIGDSHASFFSGYDRIQDEYPARSENKYPFFISYRLGAVLAYSLCKLGTKEKGREKLLELTDQLEKGSVLLLCFGEIDCRVHLLKQAQLQQKKIEDTVTDCVHKYISVIEELRAKGFTVCIWNVIPSSEAYNPEYPAFGTIQERNKVTKLFNLLLKDYTDKNGLPFISIFSNLIDEGMMTKKKYLFDGVHLGQLAMPFVLQRMKKNSQLSGWVSDISNFQLFLLSLRQQLIFQYLCIRKKAAALKSFLTVKNIKKL